MTCLRSTFLSLILTTTVVLGVSPCSRAMESVTFRIFIDSDRMCRFTGVALTEAMRRINLGRERAEHVGDEIYRSSNALATATFRSNSLLGLLPREDSRLTMESEADGAAGPAVGIRGQQETPSGCIAEVDSGAFAPGGRYRISCRIYSESASNAFRMGLNLGRQGYVWSIDEKRTNRSFVVPAKEWTTMVGTLLLPSENDTVNSCEIVHWERQSQPLRWRLADLSIRPLEMAGRDVVLRPKTEAENTFRLEDFVPDEVSLSTHGQPIPLFIENVGPEGVLTSTTRFSFWGSAPKSGDMSALYSRDNVYFLTLGSTAPPVRYRPVENALASGPAIPTIRSQQRTRRLEEDRVFQYYHPYVGPPTNRVMWETFSAPPRDRATVAIGALPDLEPTGEGVVEIEISLWGHSSLAGPEDHRWELSLNDLLLGTAAWDGATHYQFKGEIDRNRLRDTNNVLGFQSRSQAEIDQVSLDWLSLTYPARLVPLDDSLEFELPAGQDALQVEIENEFSPGPVLVFSEQEATVTPLDTPSAQDTLHFTASSSAGSATTYRAVGTSGYAPPKSIEAIAARTELALLPDLDLVIVAHRNFLEALTPLVEHRSGQGLRTAVVDVQRVYDRYSHGMFSPESLRKYLDELFSISGQEAGPRYVFLVGDATYDYLDIRGESRNFVPTMHLAEPAYAQDYAPTVAYDDYFVLGPEGDSVPRAAVGRLPAQTVDSVRAYVRKVLAYEAAASGDAAADAPRALLISAFGFEDYGKRMREGALSGWATTSIEGSGELNTDLTLPGEVVRQWNAGCDVVYFAGHGAYYMWRTGPGLMEHHADMFTGANVAELRNRGRYPIILTSTCFSSLFDAPYTKNSPLNSGVGVYLVEAPDRGAVALVGHSGKITASSGHKFAQAVLDGLIASDVQRLGDAYLAAKQRYPSAVFRGVALLGDPALLTGPRMHHAKHQNP